jgi:hypothetical protein
VKIINRFLDLNFLFLHACLWESATTGHWSLLVARLYRQRSSNLLSIAKIQRTRFQSNWLESIQHSPDSGQTSRNLTSTAGIRPYCPNFGQLGQNLEISIRFRPYWSNSSQSCQNLVRRNLATVVGWRRIPATVAEFHFTPLVIFSYESKAGKYFQEKSFFFLLKNDLVVKIKIDF